jgi:putative methionine-R-sulfoxide reductase with GAF domain
VHAVRTGSVAVSNDVRHDSRYLRIRRMQALSTTVPVARAGQSGGTLDIESAALGAFGRVEIMHYESLAAALRPFGTRHSLVEFPEHRGRVRRVSPRRVNWNPH